MSVYRNFIVPSGLLLALTIVTGLGACADPAPHDGLGRTEQASFLGDFGGALGNPMLAGDTTSYSDDYAPSCGTAGAPDASLTWTAPSSGTFTFSTAASSYDTVLEILDAGTGASLGCNDDSGGTLQSSVSRSLSAGQTVIVVIDGYSGSSGPFQLGITGSSSGPPAAGMQLWLRADAGVNAPGGRMASWADQSGNGRNASMATAARQPFFTPGVINGLPVARFKGAQSMYLDVFAQPTTFSVFVVGKNSNPSESFSMILGPGGNAPNNQLRWENGSQALVVGTGNNLPVITSSIGNTRVYHALSVHYNGSTLRVFRGNSLTTSTGVSTSGPWTLASVGSWYSTYFLNGDIAEVLIYDHALSDSDRLQVTGYLSSKYALP